MNCTNCGNKLTEDTLFCTKCGASVRAAASAAPVARRIKRRLPWKLIGIIAGAAAVFAGLVVCAVLLISSGSALRMTTNEKMLRVTHMSDGNVAFYNMRGDLVDCGVPQYSSPYVIFDMCMDGTSAYIVEDDNTLYYCTAKERTRVARDVDHASISQDGKHIIYVQRDGDTQTLNRYTVRKDTSVELAESDDADFAECSVSPDGMTVLYRVVGDDDELFLSIDGKDPEYIGNALLPLGVANHAKFAYYCSENEESSTVRIYACKNGEENQIDRVSSLEDMTVDFNIDRSEMLYCVADRTCLSVNGGDSVTLVDEKGYMVTPAALCYTMDLYDPTVYTDALPTFIGHLLYTSDESPNYTDTLYRITGRSEAEMITDGASSYRFADAGHALVYEVDGTLYYMKDTTRGDRAKQLCDDLSVSACDASGDVNKIYALTDDQVLYYVTPDGKTEKIASDVDDMCASADTGDCCFLTNDGKLYHYTAGSDKERIKTRDEPVYIYYINGVFCYYTRNESDPEAYDFYRLTDDLSSELIAKGVTSTY